MVVTILLLPNFPLEENIQSCNCKNISLFQGDLVTCGVLSGNRNFEGRIHPLTRANYLASPPLVIAYAIAGTVLIDFEKEPLGKYITLGPSLVNNIGYRWHCNKFEEGTFRRAYSPPLRDLAIFYAFSSWLAPS